MTIDVSDIAVQVWTISFRDADRQMQRYTMETALRGKWTKWHNNLNWTNEADFSATLATFVHFTYNATGGEMMVTDIQARYLCQHSTRWLMTCIATLLQGPTLPKCMRAAVCNPGLPAISVGPWAEVIYTPV
jgi:hypothetical protein